MKLKVQDFNISWLRVIYFFFLQDSDIYWWGKLNEHLLDFLVSSKDMAHLLFLLWGHFIKEYFFYDTSLGSWHLQDAIWEAIQYEP